MVTNAMFEQSNTFSSYKVAPALNYMLVVECGIRKYGGCIIFCLCSVMPVGRV